MYLDNDAPEIESIRILRKLLWIRHGCEYSNLYGDDGEMQCNKCRIDFKRMSVQEIEEIFHQQSQDDWKEYLKEKNE